MFFFSGLIHLRASEGGKAKFLNPVTSVFNVIQEKKQHRRQFITLNEVGSMSTQTRFTLHSQLYEWKKK